MIHRALSAAIILAALGVIVAEDTYIQVAGGVAIVMCAVLSLVLARRPAP